MEINEKKFWGLDVTKIESLEDVKLIFAAMDLFVREDIPGFEKYLIFLLKIEFL